MDFNLSVYFLSIQRDILCVETSVLDRNKPSVACRGLYVTFPTSDGDEEVLVRGGARIQTAQHLGTAC